jgi:predicted RNase H-like HicB family nuclease
VKNFSILITAGKDGLFLASALGFEGSGNNVKEALDAWVDAIVDDAILVRTELRKAAE